MKLRRWFSSLSRGGKAAVLLTTAVAVYAVIGLWIAPPIVRSQAVEYLSTTLERSTKIEQIRFNPFTMAATIRGIELRDRDGTDFLSCAEAHGNFDPWRLFGGEIGFGELRLTEPYIHLKVLRDGTLNAADIPEAFASADEEDEEEESEPRPFVAELILIERGSFIFSDFSHPTPFTQSYGPVDVQLDNFATVPDSSAPYRFAAATEEGESVLWEGTITPSPVASRGTVALTGMRPRTGWRYIQDQVGLEISQGTFDVAMTYDFSLVDGKPALTLSDASFSLSDFEVIASDADQPLLEIPTFSVDGIAMDLDAREISCAAVKSEGIRLRGRRDPDGDFRYMKLLRLGPYAEADEDAADARESDGDADADPTADGEADSSPGGEAAPDWTFDVGGISISDFRFELDDRSVPEGALLVIDTLDLGVESLTNRPGEPAEITLALTANRTGKLDVGGKAMLTPPSAALEIDLQGFALTPLRPYVEASVPLHVMDGAVSAKGSVVVEPDDAGTPLAQYRGDITIAALKTVDAKAGHELVGWERVAFSGLAVDVEPTRLELAELAISGASVSVVVDENGVTNFAALAGADATPPSGDPGDAVGADGEVDANAGTDSAGATNDPAGAPVPFKISRVVLDTTSLSITDRSIEPRFELAVTDLEGTISGLSSEQLDRADIDLAARIDRTAKLEIVGQINPMADAAYTDLRVKLDSLGLSSFTPYTGKYIGRAISKGKLSLDLEYKLNEAVLAGENGVKVEQLSLGRSIASEEATSLPVGLAIGLLKDPQGRIGFDLPVSGNLNDPEFTLGGVILGALGNLITKVATSPFSVLGGVAGLVVGGGDELSFVAFEPGAETIGEKQQKKIEALAKALGERPALSLEIHATAARSNDGPAVAIGKVDERLREMRFAEIKKKKDAPASANEVVLDEKNRRRLTEDLYRETFGEKPKELIDGLKQAVKNGEAEEPADRDEWLRAEVSRLLAEKFAATEEDYDRLARERAATVRDGLAAQGVEPERLFVLNVVVLEHIEGNPRADLTLTGS